MISRRNPPSSSAPRRVRIIPGRRSLAATVWRLAHPQTWPWPIITSITTLVAVLTAVTVAWLYPLR
jgi:hypothetical protein